MFLPTIFLPDLGPGRDWQENDGQEYLPTCPPEAVTLASMLTNSLPPINYLPDAETLDGSLVLVEILFTAQQMAIHTGFLWVCASEDRITTQGGRRSVLRRKGRARDLSSANDTAGDWCEHHSGRTAW